MNFNNWNKHVLRYEPFDGEKARKIPGFPRYYITNYGRVISKRIPKYHKGEANTEQISETYVLKMMRGNRGPGRYVTLVKRGRRNKDGDYITPARKFSRSVSKIFRQVWPELEEPKEWPKQ